MVRPSRRSRGGRRGHNIEEIAKRSALAGGARRWPQHDERPSVTKRMLMLSVASAALFASPVLAQTTPPSLDITTATTTAVTTATACGATTACDITIESTGSITITAASPVVTINSNNAVTNSGTISNKNTTGAIGVDILTGFTANPANQTGLEDLGTIDLTGTGTGKIGIELTAPAPTTAVPTPPTTYTGPIILLGSTTTITGDQSTGILIGQGTTLDGLLDIGGTLTMNPTTTTELSDTGINAVRIDGTVTGNVTLDSTSTITVQGNNAQGFLLDGSITGSLVNQGTIHSIGIGTTQNPQTGQVSGPASSGDPEGGSAMLIGGSITGGILNSGPVNTTDTTNPTAALVTEGNAPALRIDPTLQDSISLLGTPSTAITIGVLTDTADPGYSFYNRGTIQTVPIDPDPTSPTGGGIQIIGADITGASGFSTTLKGLGFFNAGSIGASATTDTKASSGAVATALAFGDYSVIGDPTAAAGLCGTIVMTAGLCNSNEQGAGHGTITAQVSGSLGGEATAISISQFATLPSLVNLGTISASATTIAPTTVQSIVAYGIFDASGTLSNITNIGAIEASTTTLQNSNQTHIALDLAANTTGITLENQGTIIGDVILGTGNDSVHVDGTSLLPSTILGSIAFNQSATTSSNNVFDSLFVDNYGTVAGSITEGAAGVLDVHVASLGSLTVLNTTSSLTTRKFDIDNAATLNLSVSSSLVNSALQNIAVVNASQEITIGDTVKFGVAYTSYIPTAGNFVLLQAPIGQLNISQAELTAIDVSVGDTVPFLFTSASGICGYNLPGVTACAGSAPALSSELVLDLVPKTAAQLGLTGYALELFPYANAALSTDSTLGSGMVNGVTTNPLAEAAYSAFAPDASGGTRAVAISLTDQATGPVAARQRALRMYGTQPGDDTLWGQEFAEFLDNKGNHDLPGYENRGFGFALGGDGGDSIDGWYGGAFTFYTGGITQQAPQNTHTDTEWYMLTAYTDWRGKGLFLDTNINVGYGDLSGHRFINIGGISREADSKRGSEMAGGGFTTGVILVYGGTTILPQLSIDGLSLREEGYDEANGGPGLNLSVQPYYANSLRGFLGGSVRQDLDFGNFYIQPEARLGYRYDLAADPVKLRTDFQSVADTGAPGTGIFTVIGPDPERGNIVAGVTIQATTGTWSMGLNYDYVRGNGGSVSQVGTLSLLGRI